MESVVYIYDKNLCEECDRLLCVRNRASMVHDLIKTYGLLNYLKIAKSIKATEDELKLSHSSSYIDYLKKCKMPDSDDEDDEEQLEYGLAYDCPVMDRMYDFVTTIAGGSLTAAKHLMNGRAKVAINWCGGWHHAQRDSAQGFCYVNDAAIAIQALSTKFKRVMYVDFDIHHGDGVQDIFETSQRILTLSFHKYTPGFFPGTGSIEDTGAYKGKYYSLNVPLQEGVSNKSFLEMFNEIFPEVSAAFKPNAIVVQCGADCINGDPVGQSNITPDAIGLCVKRILCLDVPTLFLGGGGYNFANAARHWTYLTSVIVNKVVPLDIPDDSEFFMEYAPGFELSISPGHQRDCNTEKYVQDVVNTIKHYCTFIKV